MSMHLLSGGVIRIPLRHIYLCAVVLATAYFLALEISMGHTRRREASCAGLYRDTLDHSKNSGPKPLSADNTHEYGPESAPTELDDPDTDAEEGVDREEDVCYKQPWRNAISFCTDCFRPKARALSKMLKPAAFSPSQFPRGPFGQFRLRDTKQQNFVEDYLIKPRVVCRRETRCPYLLALQLSLSDDIEGRQAVRTTWGTVAKTKLWPNAIVNSDVQLLFVLAHQARSSKKRKRQSAGSPPTAGRHKEEQWRSLNKEAATYGDILFINMHDSYFNLTLKLLSAYKWVDTHCTSVKFVLKVDTDTFVNVPMLLDLLMLNEEHLSYSVLGTIYTQERVVHREGKWAVNETLYPPPTYPVYASGCSYVLSASALGQLIESSPFLPMDHASTFLGADFYATGVMGLLLSFKFFHVTGVELFGRCNGTDWSPCDLVSDNLVFATVPSTPGNSSAWLKLWRAFYRYYGHYR